MIFRSEKSEKRMIQLVLTLTLDVFVLVSIVMFDFYSSENLNTTLCSTLTYISKYQLYRVSKSVICLVCVQWQQDPYKSMDLIITQIYQTFLKYFPLPLQF